MQDATFAPYGSVYLIGTTPVQVLTTNNVNPTSYRIRCLVTGYISWGPNSGVPTPTAPTAGVPSPTTLGMSAGGIETFTLPPNGYFQSSNAAGFEVIAGEGV
jgi:hypothetical protein